MDLGDVAGRRVGRLNLWRGHVHLWRGLVIVIVGRLGRCLVGRLRNRLEHQHDDIGLLLYLLMMVFDFVSLSQGCCEQGRRRDQGGKRQGAECVLNHVLCLLRKQTVHRVDRSWPLLELCFERRKSRHGDEESRVGFGFGD